jgi:hypothetical protein
LKFDSVRPNLLQVMFRFIKSSSAEFVRLPVQEVNNECVLALTISEQEQQMAAVLRYDTDCFASGTITAMLEHYQLLLERIVADPKRIITDFSFTVVDNTNDGAPAILNDLSHLEDQFIF